MIEQINWHDRRGFDKKDILEQLEGKITTPFDQNGHSRPLRITYHFDGLKNLSQDERDALDVLREFSSKPLIEALQIGDGEFLPIKFGRVLDYAGVTQIVEVDYGESKIEGGIHNTTGLKRCAQDVALKSSEPDDIQQQIYDDFLSANASNGMGQDIVVTTSKWLLKNRTHPLIEKTNPRTPLETLKILGFLMRSRGDYRYAQSGRFGNQTFYCQIFVFSKIPALWRYINAYPTEKSLIYTYGNILELSDSIISRCVRAVQARDYMGVIFYRQHNQDTQDNMMYHFDYFCLLLSGIFDSQALINYRLFSMTKPQENVASFRKVAFTNELLKHNNNLAQYVLNEPVKILLDLVASIRNTIHREKLNLLDLEDRNNYRQTSLILIPELRSDQSGEKQATKTLWEICESLEKHPEWGVVRDGNNLYIEPFSFATTLLEKGFELIGEVAKRTDFSPFIPDVKNDELEKIPTNYSLLFDSTMKAPRLILLG